MCNEHATTFEYYFSLIRNTTIKICVIYQQIRPQFVCVENHEVRKKLVLLTRVVLSFSKTVFYLDSLIRVERSPKTLQTTWRYIMTRKTFPAFRYIMFAIHFPLLCGNNY